MWTTFSLLNVLSFVPLIVFQMCRRRKAAFEAYQERELAELRKEKPGLKQSQYKEMIFKAWQKSPENPMNCAQ